MVDEDEITVIQAKSLNHTPHGFLGRTGGVSVGIHGSLNVGLGSDDDPLIVEENRRRATQAILPGATLATVYQVHSSDVVVVSQPFDAGERPKADGLVTDRPGILLGILTADCGPVLFSDQQAGIVAAAHAGWKGAFAGVTDNIIDAMEKLGAARNRIVAAVGPCIARTSYEVDANFLSRFGEQDPTTERFFSPGRSDHYQFDLEGYIVHRLALGGIKRIEALGIDTYSDQDRFYSYRRATHKGEADYGRQISLIGIAK